MHGTLGFFLKKAYFFYKAASKIYFPKIEIPYDPEIPLLGIYLKKSKALTWKDRCTIIFTETWFIIAKIWKQARCQLTDE